MTFRADNPEVPTELRDLAQCFRSGRQAMSFSQERAYAPYRLAVVLAR